MSLSTTDEIKRTFNLAALRREAKAGLTGRQWEKHSKITQRSENVRKLEEALFKTRYVTRVEIAKKRLINNAGSKVKTLEHPWAQNDRFDGEAITRQARREVRNSHKQRLRRIDQIETQEITKLLKKAIRENRLQGKAQRAFGKSADRRLGAERRQTRALKPSR